MRNYPRRAKPILAGRIGDGNRVLAEAPSCDVRRRRDVGEGDLLGRRASVGGRPLVSAGADGGGSVAGYDVH